MHILCRGNVPVAILIPILALAQVPPEAPRTVAEKSDYQATSRYAEVLAYAEQLAKASPLVRLGTLGESAEGRKLPLLILSDPPISSYEEAFWADKPVVFVLGNIHAGEVDGKEAILMVARDLVLPRPSEILKHLTLVFCPIFNADGNERVSVENRRAQNGPAGGVGIRANAQGFDLNRDFIKLESPEVRALVRFLNEWDPAIVVDCHTTNGSYHRFALTYEGGRCPAGDPAVIAYTRDTLLPEVSRTMLRNTGYRSWFYGNFNADRSRWETVQPTARYGTHYIGLRKRIAILSESYSYAPFKDRVLASKGFVESICEFAARHRDDIRKLLRGARQRASREIILRHEPKPLGRPVNIPGWVEEVKEGRRVRTDQPKEYEVLYYGDDKPTLTVTRPTGYVLPPQLTAVRENLERHGIRVHPLTEPTKEWAVEVYRVEKITRAAAFQRHQPVTLEVTSRAEKRRFTEGTLFVSAGQNLGSLAAYLLEPQSSDGLATWNFFDDVLKEGGEYPVVRLMEREE